MRLVDTNILIYAASADPVDTPKRARAYEILAAAKILGCDAVYSEDMSDQQDYDGVRVINPFVERTERASEPPAV